MRPLTAALGDYLSRLWYRRIMDIDDIPFPAFRAACIVCPIVVEYATLSLGSDVRAWRVLFIFGVRVAAWRCPSI